MKKKKATKEKRLYHKLTLWLGVLVLGTIVGVSIQFGRAWVEPSLNAPEGNIAAPINTGASEQTKVGTATQKADICVDAFGNGDVKCLSSLVSFPACTLAGGVPTMVGSMTLCKFPGASCPAPWTQYLKYTETSANTCTGGGGCGTSVTSGSHSFDNIDPAGEAKTYYDGGQTAYPCQASWCVDGCGCNGYPSDLRCCCYFPTITCYTDCSSTAKTCNSTVTAIGCVQ